MSTRKFGENLAGFADFWARCAEAKGASASLESAPKNKVKIKTLGDRELSPKPPSPFFAHQSIFHL
ncbi:MAG: hypothetical protein HQL51_01405 [Magnetococcales bacterium]|nr:hypothetical protein [Magnetococcales bacterium]